MPTDVIMPQMGESIFEGTITKWLKKPGDKVNRDEPLFEISTDKVDAEIPSPTAGVLKEIKVPEGTTVQVNTVVGTIAAEGEAAGAPAAAPQAAAPAAQETRGCSPRRPNLPRAAPAPEPAKAAAKKTGGAVSTEGPSKQAPAARQWRRYGHRRRGAGGRADRPAIPAGTGRNGRRTRAVVAAGPPHRAREQHRPEPGEGHWPGRTNHQGRHQPVRRAPAGATPGGEHRGRRRRSRRRNVRRTNRARRPRPCRLHPRSPSPSRAKWCR